MGPRKPTYEIHYRQTYPLVSTAIFLSFQHEMGIALAPNLVQDVSVMSPGRNMNSISLGHLYSA